MTGKSEAGAGTRGLVHGGGTLARDPFRPSGLSRGLAGLLVSLMLAVCGGVSAADPPSGTPGRSTTAASAAAESAPATLKPITVRVLRGKGVGRSVKQLLEDLGTVDRLLVSRITAQEIRDGGLSEADVVVFPGGSGGRQGRSLGADGRDAVRRFVDGGGGFVGICAGAYLATADYDWSLHILDARVLDRKHWARGFGDVTLATAPPCRDALQFATSDPVVYYHQGPLLAPADDGDIPDYRPWATFVTEVRRDGVSGGVMPGTCAIASGQFGAGRVLAISPHPEKTPGMDHVIPHAVVWVAGDQAAR